MRQLARFDSETPAQTLADALLVVQIDSSVQQSRDGQFAVWVHDERALDRARVVLADFEADPTAHRYAGVTAEAEQRRRNAARDERRAEKRTINARQHLAASTRRGGVGPVTLLLIIASVAVAVATTTQAGLSRLDLGDNLEVVSQLSFQSYVKEDGYFRWYAGLTDLRSGQLWRLFTPMFLHFGLLHIVFNMWWLRDLGTLVERRQSTWLLAVMVLVIALLSNTGQYLVTGSPAFGGMSGVVYGLFGYVWIRGRYDPASGYAISRQTVIWMVGFFALCFTGLLGPVANAAHTVGLLLGAGWGFVSSGKLQRLWR